MVVNIPKTSPMSLLARMRSDVLCLALDLKVAYIPTANIAAKNIHMQIKASTSIPVSEGISVEVARMGLSEGGCVSDDGCLSDGGGLR